MASPEKVEAPFEGRQAAHRSRARASLIKAAQEVIAEVGLDATIEQVADHAGVTPRTIYNHFENKNALFIEALNQVWESLVFIAKHGKTGEENFQSMLDTGRKMFRIDQSNPTVGKILRNTLSNPSFAIDAFGAAARSVLHEVAGPSGLKLPNFEKRVFLFAHMYAGILNGVYVTRQLTPEDADVALGIALAVWDIPAEKAREMTSGPLAP